MADVRRRFLPGLRNFFALYLPLADYSLLYQAEIGPPRLVVRWTGPRAEVLQPDIYERIKKQAVGTSAG